MRHKSSFKILKLTLKNTNNNILKSIYDIVVDENYLAIISLLNLKSFNILLLQIIKSKKIFLFIIKYKKKSLVIQYIQINLIKFLRMLII